MWSSLAAVAEEFGVYVSVARARETDRRLPGLIPDGRTVFAEDRHYSEFLSALFLVGKPWERRLDVASGGGGATIEGLHGFPAALWRPIPRDFTYLIIDYR
jgi:hypothetical protein